MGVVLGAGALQLSPSVDGQNVLSSTINASDVFEQGPSYFINIWLLTETKTGLKLIFSGKRIINLIFVFFPTCGWACNWLVTAQLFSHCTAFKIRVPYFCPSQQVDSLMKIMKKKKRSIFKGTVVCLITENNVYVVRFLGSRRSKGCQIALMWIY